METIITWMLDIAVKNPAFAVYFLAVGVLVSLIQVIIWITPSKVDDLYLQKVKDSKFGFLISYFGKFAPWGKLKLPGKKKNETTSNYDRKGS